MDRPASFSFIFSLFSQIIQFLQQFNVKNVTPVSCTGIQTHKLLFMSLLKVLQQHTPEFMSHQAATYLPTYIPI